MIKYSISGRAFTNCGNAYRAYSNPLFGLMRPNVESTVRPSYPNCIWA